MALLFIEGFEQYTTPGDMIGPYSSTSAAPCRWEYTSNDGQDVLSTTTFRTTQPGGTSKSLQISYNNRFSILRIPTSTDLYIGFNYRIDSIAGAARIISVSDSNAGNPATGVYFYFNTNGSLAMARCDTGAIFFTTAANAIVINTWYYMEIKVVFGTTTGSVELKVDNVSVATATSINTKNAIAGSGYTYLTFTGGSSATAWHDDMYVCDNTGTTNNTFLGPTSVYTLFPTAAGTTTTLTPVGAASNWDCVNETNADYNTTYVKTSNTNEIDYYNVSDLGVTPAAIFGVGVGSIATKASYAARNMRNKVKVGASVTNGANSDPLIHLNYRKMEDILETKPGGGAWALADINNLEIGVEST